MDKNLFMKHTTIYEFMENPILPLTEYVELKFVQFCLIRNKTWYSPKEF